MYVRCDVTACYWAAYFTRRTDHDLYDRFRLDGLDRTGQIYRFLICMVQLTVPGRGRQKSERSRTSFLSRICAIQIDTAPRLITAGSLGYR